MAPLDRLRDFQAAQFGQIKVQEDNVRRQLIDRLNSRDAIRRLTYYDEVGFRFDAPPDSAPKQRVVVDDQDLRLVQCLPLMIGRSDVSTVFRPRTLAMHRSRGPLCLGRYVLERLSVRFRLRASAARMSQYGSHGMCGFCAARWDPFVPRASQSADIFSAIDCTKRAPLTSPDRIVRHKSLSYTPINGQS